MRFWFSRITDQADARRVIKSSSTAFFLLAAMQIGVAVILTAAGTKPGAYLGFPPDAAINYLVTAGFVIMLASMLRRYNSRVAAAVLLFVFLGIAATTPINSAGNTPSGNLGLAIIAIFIAIRAIYATTNFHGLAAENGEQVLSDAPSTGPVPRPEEPVRPKPYDVDKWEAIVKYDDDIAMVEQKLRPLGEKWVDEFARAFLILNDKKYLAAIVQKIIKAAREEAAYVPPATSL